MRRDQGLFRTEMPVIGHIMLALVYITASALGAVALYQYLAYEPVTAALIGAASSLALIQLHMAVSRLGGHEDSDKRFFEVRDEMRKLATRVAQSEQRFDSLKDSVEKDMASRREILVNEMRGLEDMISKLGRKFESRMQAVRASAVETGHDGASALDAVREALRENRVDLHLQPIVNLPQRRVCYYEGFTRLRRADGQLIMPNEFLGAAERANLLGVIDNMLLFRCVQIVRRLSERDRRVGVFCNVAMASLEDDVFFTSFIEFMKENRDLAGSMIFELGVRNFLNRSETAARNMGRLRDLGFRFSLDKGEGLAFDLPQLQHAGVKFVKIQGERLLEELAPGGERPISAISRDIAPEDVPVIFTRYGIDIIAEKVEAEKSVIELLEYGIPFGQGHVFGAPRPIKGSLLDETAPPPDFIRRVSAAM
jgi:cyclic-di-GMP phosphodiesterase TipF (flagellum assembly factor)